MTLQTNVFKNPVDSHLGAHYPIEIARGVDHLRATNRAFVFQAQAASQWPIDLTGYAITLEVKIKGVAALAGTGSVLQATMVPGSPSLLQKLDCEVLATAFDESRIPNGTGTFQVIGTKDGNRVLLVSGIVRLTPDMRPGSLD